MKTVNVATQKENTTTFFIDNCGDIHDTQESAENDHVYCVGKVVVDNFFVGSIEEMRVSALAKYNEAA